MDRIGVLELVDEQVSELSLQSPAHANILAEDAGCEVEEIAVIEGVEAAALSRSRCPSLRQQADREPIHILTPLREIRLNDTREEVEMQSLNPISQELLLFRDVRPPFLGDLGLAVPGGKQRCDNGGTLNPASRYTQLSTECAGRLLNLTSGVHVNWRGQVFLEFLPEPI